MSDETAGWAADFRDLRAEIDSSVEALEQLIAATKVRMDPDLHAELDVRVIRLAEHLERARKRSNELCERFVERPVMGFWRGRALTREEFYLTLAVGLHSYTAKAAGLSEFGDFEVFRFFQYEDEERRCYINPGMEPLPPGRLRLHGGGVGEPPESLFWSKLRPEQQTFFAEYLPEIAARFLRSV